MLTQIDRMIFWFRMRGHKATLGEILRSGEPWAHEFNARKSDARRQGYVFILKRGPSASENMYMLAAEPGQDQLGLAI